jgi:hypothetical protein
METKGKIEKLISEYTQTLGKNKIKEELSEHIFRVANKIHWEILKPYRIGNYCYSSFKIKGDIIIAKWESIILGGVYDDGEIKFHKDLLYDEVKLQEEINLRKSKYNREEISRKEDRIKALHRDINGLKEEIDKLKNSI